MKTALCLSGVSLAFGHGGRCQGNAARGSREGWWWWLGGEGFGGSAGVGGGRGRPRDNSGAVIVQPFGLLLWLADIPVRGGTPRAVTGKVREKRKCTNTYTRTSVSACSRLRVNERTNERTRGLRVEYRYTLPKESFPAGAAEPMALTEATWL